MPVEEGMPVGGGRVAIDGSARSLGIEDTRVPGLTLSGDELTEGDSKPNPLPMSSGNIGTGSIGSGTAPMGADALGSGSLGAGSLSPGSLLGDQDLRVVTARGTEHGLVLRIDGKSEWSVIHQELSHFLGGRKKFFEGGEVSIEWIDRLPSSEQAKELGEHLLSQYGLTVVTRRRRFQHDSRPFNAVGPGGGQLVPGIAGAVSSGPGAAPTIHSQAGHSQAGHSQAGSSHGSGSAGMAGEDAGVSASELLADFQSGYHGAYHGESGAAGKGSPPRSGAGRGVTINLFQEKEAAETAASARGSKEIGTSSPRAPGAGAPGARGTDELEESGMRRSYEDELDSMMSGNFGSDRFYSGDAKDAYSTPRRMASQMAKMLGGPDLFYEDDANAKILFGTLRSGQRVETPFSLVLVGDVNPGADLIAGGDIIVLGSLRGTAHASAYDDDAFDRVIIAFQMQPMQLRIGSVLSRGSEEVVRGAEIARIENRRIVVEAYNPRMVWGRKLK